VDALRRFNDKVSTCPHGYVTVYCALCLGKRRRVKAEQAATDEKKNEKAPPLDTIKRQSAVITNQSAAMDRQSAEIQRLRKQVMVMQSRLAAKQPRGLARLFGGRNG
jgi:hypothetical protein